MDVVVVGVGLKRRGDDELEGGESELEGDGFGGGGDVGLERGGGGVEFRGRGGRSWRLVNNSGRGERVTRGKEKRETEIGRKE